MTCVGVQVRGSIEEAEELQDEDDKKDEDGERTVKPASRERQKELLGRLPPSDRQRGRQMDYSPYESKQHSQSYDMYDDY